MFAPPDEVLAEVVVLAVEPPDPDEPPDALFDVDVESFVLDVPPLPDCAPEEVAVDEAVSELLAVPPLPMLVVAVPVSPWELLFPLVAVVLPLVASALVASPLVALSLLPLPQLAKPTNSETVTKLLIDMKRIVLSFARPSRTWANFVADE